MLAMKNKLRILTAVHNLTQAELAREVDVSRQTINSIEASRYIPSTLLALKLARFFQAPVEEIFSIQDDE